MTTIEDANIGLGNKQGWGKTTGAAKEWSQTYDPNQERAERIDTEFHQLAERLKTIRSQIQVASRFNLDTIKYHPQAPMILRIQLEQSGPGAFEQKIAVVVQDATSIDGDIPNDAQSARDEYVLALRVTQQELKDYKTKILHQFAWFGYYYLVENKLPSTEVGDDQYRHYFNQFLGID